jgi:hypothetical protein
MSSRSDPRRRSASRRLFARLWRALSGPAPLGRLVLACYLALPIRLAVAYLLAPGRVLAGRQFEAVLGGADPEGAWVILVVYALSPVLVPLALILNGVEILFPVVRRFLGEGSEPSTAEFVAGTIQLWGSFLVAFAAAHWIVRAIQQRRRCEATDEGAP